MHCLIRTLARWHVRTFARSHHSFVLLALAVAVLLSACGSVPQAGTDQGAAAASGSVTATVSAATPISLGMGYIPDVQFAPFYVAQEKGYYAAEGLAVSFDHSDIRDALVQVAQGKLTFANAAGDEILLARAQSIPVKLVFQTYQKFPIAVFSKQSAGITKPEDLKGKIVGIPGRFGATYIGLRGLLHAANIPEQAVQMQEIGFTQAAAVREDKVPAAVGYVSNEPLLLEADGVPVNVIKVADYINLVSNGIVASEATIKQQPDLIKRFNRATARGLQDTLDDPEAAFKLALKYIPELKADQQPQELKKLKQTLDLWRAPAQGLGYSDPNAWQTTYRFLRDSGILQRDLDVQQAFTNDLLK